MVKEDGIGRPDPIAPTSAVIDITTAIEELHKLSPLEMKKIMRDSHSLNFRLASGKGAFVSVDIERLATFLPLHLLASVASSISQPRFRYLLRGVRLLHSLSSLAPRFPKLEQILLQEVRLREQIIDLVILTLIVLADVEPDGRWGSFLAVLHSALVACCLYLLKSFVTPEWRDVVPVLLAHPKVDIFIDAAFDAVRRDIVLLQGRFKALSAKSAKDKSPTACGTELVSSTTLDHCEASLQVLQSLCEPQAFRDRILQHKELCTNGGILSLVLVVLQLQLPSHLQHIPSLAASISRLKAKVLAMLLKFSETEPISFLDEVATDERTMQIAKLVAAEIVSLVQGAFFESFTVQMVHEDIEKCPAGMLYLNAMRLADVLSDDSNFRNLFMDRIAPDLATILAMDPSEFHSKWCGGCSAQDMADCEIDATLVYDPFHGSGAAMLSFKPSGSSSDQGLSGCTLSIKPVEPTFYAQELSAILVKLFANLHCYNPEVCPADEKDRFLSLFMRCLSVGPLSPDSSSFFMTSDQTAVRVCENLHILVDHVASLPSDLANDEDVQLASVFAAELHEAFCLSPVDAQTEAPVVTFVRDAHEQRLRAIVARRLPSERWQRLQRQMEENTRAQAMATPQEDTAQLMAEEASSAADSKADAEAKVEAEPVPEALPQPKPEPKAEAEAPAEEECVSDIKDVRDTTAKIEPVAAADIRIPVPEPEPEPEPGVRAAEQQTEPVEKTDTAFEFRHAGLTTPAGPSVDGGRETPTISQPPIVFIDRPAPQLTAPQPLLSPPQLTAPQLVTPQFTPPQLTAPLLVTPQLTAPQLTAPQHTAPQFTAPQHTAPQFTAPPLTAPQLTSTQFTAPQLTSTQFTAPQLTTPQFTAPQFTAPQFTAPQLTTPQLTTPQLTAPLLATPQLVKPQLTPQFTPQLTPQFNPQLTAQPVTQPRQITPLFTPVLDQRRLGVVERKETEEERAGQVRKLDEAEGDQPRKRQRRIMSENQIAVMESALKDEPEMQRYPDRVQYWTNALNKMGPEISCNQLKNWINNRKAKLAKLAKEGRLDPAQMAERNNRAKAYLTPEIPEEPVRPYLPLAPLPLQMPVAAVQGAVAEAEPSVTQIGQRVALRDDYGREIAIGVTKAVTPGEEGSTAMCLVEIELLKVDRSTKLPIGSDFMGTTFDEAEKKLGKLIVAWPSNNVRVST